MTLADLQHIPFGGIATLIGAVGGFVTALVAATLNVLNFFEQRRHRETLCNIQDKVTAIQKGQTNGQATD